MGVVGDFGVIAIGSSRFVVTEIRRDNQVVFDTWPTNTFDLVLRKTFTFFDPINFLNRAEI